MKKSMLSIILALIIVAGVSAQDKPVLMTIAGEEIGLAEFERIYRKNNNESSLNKQSPEEYLELFINFKLKVMEAQALGMDTTAKFTDELEGYRKQLAKPYMVDEETRESLMQEAYERMKEDVNASHILIKMPANPTPEDTLKAYEKIMEIRQRIVGGKSFETVARATSDDASVVRNGGNLGYFSAFSMIYDFETVAYTSPLNKISMPFKSSYGYHILMVHDRRPALGQAKVAHIFIRTPEQMDETMRLNAYERVQSVYDSLEAGKDFAAMAMKYSEDPGSSKKGGEIPWFGTGRMIPEFEKAAFGIEEIGSWCKPVKSFYGWHIIKLMDKKGIGSYEDMKPEIQEKANRGDRMKHQNDIYLSKLKEENGFTEYPEGLDLVYAGTDLTLVQGKWNGADLKGNSTPILKIGDKTLSSGDFVDFILEKQGSNEARTPQTVVTSLYKEYCKNSILAWEESHLGEKFPDFRYIYEEYHDGILLFDIMDQKVWSKAVADTTGLEAFHKDHEKDYMWEERADVTLLTCSERTDMKVLRKAYKKILKGKLDEADLNSKCCSNDTIPCISMEQFLLEKGERKEVDAVWGQVGLWPVQTIEGQSSFVLMKKINKPEPRKLDEARGQITSDYQNYLEEQWIMELKQKYFVEVDQSLLARIKP